MCVRRSRERAGRLSSCAHSRGHDAQVARSRRSRNAPTDWATPTARYACANRSSWSDVIHGAAHPAFAQGLIALEMLNDGFDLLPDVHWLKRLIVDNGVTAATIPTQM